MPQPKTTAPTQGRRARRLLLCATGGYQCYALPGFVLSLLRHFADDVQVVLSRAAAKLVSRAAVEVATREGLEEHEGPFPLPTLLARMSSVLGSSSKAGVPRREEPE